MTPIIERISQAHVEALYKKLQNADYVSQAHVEALYKKLQNADYVSQAHVEVLYNPYRSKASARGSVITLGPKTISGEVETYSIEHGSGIVDVTGCDEGGQNFAPGMPVHAVTLDILFSAAGAWSAIRSIAASGEATTMTIKPESESLTLSFVCYPERLPVSATPDSSVKIGSVRFVQMGPIAGKWLFS
jgi:hypothetical protein